MRVSRAQAEENRETVINVASRLFREHGFDGIGLKDLMKGAGLTQGGFYKQFASKDDLAAQASRRAMESATRRWSEAAADSSDPLEAVMAFYLSKDHRGEKAEGCPLVALGSDATRQSEEVRRPFEDGIRAHFEVLNELLDDTRSSNPSGKAMAILSLMVGAVTLSRIMEDENTSQGILDAAAEEIRRIAGADHAA
ncbi:MULTISPECIES: TetR/AcrR family transcriptional regulator [Rhizobium/Agrobacterium group]|jgi:TetR/AcrR family transcriptional repressor of nem operon|uniref:TetR/AcrR family transcriptional regulator n=1 Tax=Agrobacterium tumefaciens TaxID=358 RepID=A0A1B9UHS6_AGRTU|nr:MULTISPECIES: TetR/AcrR family transcriptional regulator [Rhizobium/Agrobacterium group]AKC09727.1 TetR family transcriptional regulator [Agrobacterium tumefaciens]EHJ95124.1 TetR family transcriptional regulator [Agrobacterium tumefaciens 5A]MDP9562108.1 TetR/AcrR family transcriptional repressor of nem operon [Rhizobium nepotum]AYM13573.1 TetR/AcrR family transcriptional regulator, transcriptional repressor for nem operon [Agrobacterium tumefaciens]AYM18871.1 TetR/AcrR family transcriptio